MTHASIEHAKKVHPDLAAQRPALSMHLDLGGCPQCNPEANHSATQLDGGQR